jgi:hypothetical protein
MTRTEYEAWVNKLRLSDRQVSEDLRVDYTTAYRWRTGKASINPRNAYVLKLYFSEKLAELNKDNFTGDTK